MLISFLIVCAIVVKISSSGPWIVISIPWCDLDLLSRTWSFDMLTVMYIRYLHDSCWLQAVHGMFVCIGTICVAKSGELYRAALTLWYLSTCILQASGPDSVVGIATGYGLDGPGIESQWGARFSTLVQTVPGAHTAFCTMDTGSFPGVKSGRDVTLTPHPLLVPWSWKSRTIPLHPLWAVRPVQGLSACTRVYFTFLYCRQT
jgi:hypothetical protein